MTSQLHCIFTFHPTFSYFFFLSQWITKVFQKQTQDLFQRPLFLLQYFSLPPLPQKTSSDFLHVKKEISLNTAFLQNYSSLISFILNFLSLLPLLYFLSPIQSSRYLAYMITCLYSIMFIIVNPNGFLKVFSYLNSLVGWILFTTAQLNRNPPFSWIT